MLAIDDFVRLHAESLFSPYLTSLRNSRVSHLSFSSPHKSNGQCLPQNQALYPEGHKLHSRLPLESRPMIEVVNQSWRDRNQSFHLIILVTLHHLLAIPNRSRSQKPQPLTHLIYQRNRAYISNLVVFILDSTKNEDENQKALSHRDF